MKGEDGAIISQHTGIIDDDNQQDAGEEAKSDLNSSRATTTPAVIQAENTLDMIQAALGGGKAPAKKKKVAKKAAVKKKDPADAMDTTTRFFNNYGENPHLQQIENGYLQFLSAQHAKESHLKAVKKFQIMYALKKIQRYWKQKYI